MVNSLDRPVIDTYINLLTLGIAGIAGIFEDDTIISKIPEEVRSHSKKSEVFRRRPKSSEVSGRV